MKKNIIITIVGVLILTCIFALARTTTTDLGLVKPTWDENIDILTDLNANSDILEAFANDPLEFDTGERLEDRVGAMFTGNTETFITLTYQDGDNTIDAVVPVKDEDNMASNSDTYLATQQSIKAYADGLHALQYLKTEIDTLSEVETLYGVNITDSTELAAALGAYYLKTAIDTQGEVEDIWGVTLATDTELGVVRDVTNYADSPMVVTGGAVSEGTNAGTFKVAALTALLRATDSTIGVLTYVTLAEQDNQAITAANIFYYVVLSYNGGSPTISVSESMSNNTQNIYIGAVMKDGSNNVHYYSGGLRLQDGVRKLHRRAKILRQIELDGGSTIAYSGTNNFTMAIGYAYSGINEFELSAYNSATTQFTPVYQDGIGGWTEGTLRNTIDYAHYDDGDGTLGEVGVAKYGTHWVYRHVDDAHVYVLYGRGSYSLSAAEEEAEPTRPSHLTEFGVLIGKIVAPQAGGSFTTIQMVTETFFTGTAVSNHADLSNLDYASAGHTGFAASGANSDITSLAGLTTPLSIAQGGTGQNTAQLAINALTSVAAATNEHVLTKDTATGNAIFKAGGAGYSNLTQFVDQTAWRLFYSNADGDVTELAFGVDGTYLKSTGVDSAPIFDAPAGAGDMLKATYDTDADNDIDVAAGGTEKSSWTQYAIPYLSDTTVFGEIPIGTAGYVLTVNGTTDGYTFTDVWTEAENTAAGYIAEVVEDTTPELGGELDAGAHSVGFTLQTATGDGTTTIDWRLGNKFKFTFGAQNETFTFTAPTNPCTLMLTLVQDGTGSRTATWPATVKWAGGAAPTLTTAANARDKVALDWDGTQYDGVCSKDFK